ncbi:MAG: Flp family type IVb pilin [Planctomycetota bacterium]
MLGRCTRKGQSTTEYILIVVLVAILSIGIITVFGNQIRDLFKVATGRMGGSTDDDAIYIDDDIADQAPGEVRKSMTDLKRSGP